MTHFLNSKQQTLDNGCSFIDFLLIFTAATDMRRIIILI